MSVLTVMEQLMSVLILVEQLISTYSDGAAHECTHTS